MPFKRKWVNLIDLFLKTIGVNVHKKNIRWYEFYQFAALFPIINGTVHISLYAFVNRGFINDAIIGVGYLAAISVVFASVYILRQKRHKILKILTLIDANVYQYPFEDNLEIDFEEILNEEYFFKVVFFIFAYESLGFSIAIVNPLITFLFTGVFQACVIPSWYPQYGHGISGILINSFFQTIGSVATFWVYNVSQILMTNITLEFLRQFQRLKVAIRSVQKVTEIMVMEEMKVGLSNELSSLEYENQFGKKFNIMYRGNFSHCVRHHQMLTRLFQDFEPLFSMIYSVELAISVASFALAFYNVLFVRDRLNFLSVAGCALVLLSNFFSKCIIGEVFAQLNEDIRNVTFYDTNWWELSLENKKLLFIFHNNTNTTSLNLKGIFIYNASYYTFSQIVRVSYSFLNLVRTSLIKY